MVDTVTPVYVEININIGQLLQTPPLRPGPAVTPYNVPEDAPVGFRMDQEHYPDLLRIIREGNYNRGTDNIIRNVLGVVATLVNEPHGDVMFCHIQVYLHFDCEQL